MILVRFQGKQFNITVIQAYAPTTDAKGAEVDQFYEDLQFKIFKGYIPYSFSKLLSIFPVLYP